MNLKNFYVDARMNWMRHHGTLKFITAHMNSVLIEIREDFKLSSMTITHKFFKKTDFLLLYPLDIGTNHQDCPASTQQSNLEKADEIGCIANVSIAPIDME